MMRAYLFAAMTALALVGIGCPQGLPAPTGEVPNASAPAVPVPPRAIRLDFSSGGLEKVPPLVFDRTDLEELDLSGNRLTGALPAEIRRLRNLRWLDASGNLMTGVPAEIGQLTELEDLDLSNNKLTGLPLELGNLQKLRRLDLRGNDISRQDLDAIRAQLKSAEILVD